MSKKGVNIKIEANTKSAAQGIQKVTEQLNGLAKNTKSKLSVFSQLGSAVSGVQASFSMVTSAMKAAKDAVMDCVNAYQTQAQAEVQLEAAAKNNPYLNAANVQSLKDYASQLQSMSTFGDEELLPLMAQLASAGRTQAEIQDIMSASVDIAASGTMSLESAVKNLSKTYSGLSGELGEANPAIKSLTTEQLKNGEAVKVMKSQYSGMAQSIADATGGWKQFQNTLGDLKEVIGQNFADGQNSAGKILNGFLSSVVSKLQESNKEAQEFKTKIADIVAVDGGTLTDSQAAQKTADESAARLANLRRSQDALNMSADEFSAIQEKNLALFNSKIEGGYDAAYRKLKGDVERLEQAVIDAGLTGTDTTFIVRNLTQARQELAVFEAKYKAEHDRLQKELDDSNKDYNKRRLETTKDFVAQDIAEEEKLFTAAQAKADELKKKEDAAAKSAASAAAKQSANDTALAAQTKYFKTMQEFDAQQERERYLAEKTGESYDEQAAAVSRLSAMTSAYFTARKEAGNTISDGDSWTKSTIKAIAAQTQKVKELKAAAEDAGDAAEDTGEKFSDWYDKELMDAYQSDIDSVMNNAALSINDQIEMLETLKDEWSLNEDAVKALDEAIKGLKEQADKLKENPIKEWLSSDNGQFVTNLNDVVGKFSEAMNAAADNQLTQIENIKDAELSSLEAQKDQGIITEEEYQEKKKEIEKKAAKEEYKYKLAQWASNVVVTTGQVAMAIVQALASMPPPLSYAMAAATSALGAAQLAAVIGSKPVPPSYATGGVVGGYSGASLGGDNTYIHARKGEMMLNAAQQRNLFDIANSRSGGNSGLKVNIQNYMGDSAEATASLDEDTLNIIIDRRVTGQLANGSYGAALTKSNVKSRGTVITS